MKSRRPRAKHVGMCKRLPGQILTNPLSHLILVFRCALCNKIFTLSDPEAAITHVKTHIQRGPQVIMILCITFLPFPFE